MTAIDVHAQINIGGVNPTTYNQSFDTPTLANTGTTTAFANNVTVPGLYATRAGATPTTYRISNGSDTTGSLYSYGVNGSTERAFGSEIVAVNNVFFGFRFVNTSSSLIISSFNIQYIGEQWRRADNPANSQQQLTFAYAVFDSNTGSINDPDQYNTFTNLNFVVNNTTPGGAAGVNGPLTTQSFNQTVVLTGQDEAVLPGQELWIRWQDTRDNGANHGLAIDNVQMSFTLVPEISTLHAMIFGGIVFVIPAVRIARRRNAKKG
ncbi:MAG: hypothetical protein H8F28_17595 [Fibrella sp.]|nr:hypothetical protein [Armatimonadota bacterium]